MKTILMTGAAGRIGKNDTAFNHRDAPYSFLIVSVWPGRIESEQNIRWTDEFWQLQDAPGRWLILPKPVPLKKLVAAVRWLERGGDKPRELE